MCANPPNNTHTHILTRRKNAIRQTAFNLCLGNWCLVCSLSISGHVTTVWLRKKHFIIKEKNRFSLAITYDKDIFKV